MAEFIEDIELDDEEVIAPAPRREFLTDEKPDENGLYEHFSITVDKGQSMMRLDKYLATHIENCSRNRVQTAVDNGNAHLVLRGIRWLQSMMKRPTM